MGIWYKARHHHPLAPGPMCPESDPAPPLTWQPSAAAPSLPPGALHLWLIPTDDRGADLEGCLALLGGRQQRRAQGMGHAAYRERYIRAHGGLRRVLGLYLNRPPQALVFSHGPAGKPYLPEAGGSLEFNLTTTADLALVAVSGGEEIGIDCEWVRPRRDFDGIARRMFTPEQARALAAAPEPDRPGQFYRAWTALEADAKADGRGLFRPRAPGAIPPAVRNFVPAPAHLAAVARATLPPIERWLALTPSPVD